MTIQMRPYRGDPADQLRIAGIVAAQPANCRHLVDFPWRLSCPETTNGLNAALPRITSARLPHTSQRVFAAVPMSSLWAGTCDRALRHPAEYQRASDHRAARGSWPRTRSVTVQQCGVSSVLPVGSILRTATGHGHGPAGRTP